MKINDKEDEGKWNQEIGVRYWRYLHTHKIQKNHPEPGVRSVCFVLWDRDSLCSHRGPKIHSNSEISGPCHQSAGIEGVRHPAQQLLVFVKKEGKYSIFWSYRLKTFELWQAELRKAKGIVFQLHQIHILQMCLMTATWHKKASRDTPEESLSTCRCVPAIIPLQVKTSCCIAECTASSWLPPTRCQQNPSVCLSRHYQMFPAWGKIIWFETHCFKEILNPCSWRSKLISLKPK